MDFSFIAENMMIEIAKMQELIELIESTHHKAFWEVILAKQGKTIHKAVDFSFIAENMMIEIAKMQELIELIESTHHKAFWEVILGHINPQDLTHSGFSEFETYGNFIALAYPNTFHITQRKRDRYAKELIGENPSIKLLQWYGFSEFETYGNFIALAYPNTFHITQRKRDRYAKELIGENPSIKLLQWYGRSYEVIGLESWSKENTRISTLLQNPLARILPPKMFKKLLRFYVKLKCF